MENLARSLAAIPATVLARAAGPTTGLADVTGAATLPWEIVVPLIIGLPLAGFAVTALVGRRLDRRAFVIPVIAVIGSWILAMAVVAAVLSGQPPFAPAGWSVRLWEWIPAGRLDVPVGLFVDPLAAVLLIVVATVGMLVHVYSIGYMAHDPGLWRFFAYLNLFMVSMFLLVLADSWLLLFVAWELVGLSSYLLIGFWYRRRSAALAAKKAFIVNRIGDLGFALGIIAIWVNTGTFQIRPSLEAMATAPDRLTIPITIVALLVFCGAVGKSAQFPLHVWLPDAMEGPTPVSALIHAATMVNAGVYMVARAAELFAAAPQAMLVVAAIGTFTAILAASIAFTQTDIKRVLAYSTVSQLGYMFAALGVGAWTAAIFHLFAQGFTKGLLFLDSGSVIHAVHDEQDMRRMGGLARHLPITFGTMLVGALAMAGIPPFVPFFSKDEILGEAFKAGFGWVWAVGILVAAMTAFYMFRLIGLTFWGESRVDPAVRPRIHESPATMTVPLVLLALCATVLGMVVGLPFGDAPFAHWLAPVFAPAVEMSGRTEAAFQLFGLDGALILASVVVAALGIAAAGLLFGWEVLLHLPPRPQLVARLTAASPATRFLYRASLNKWWFDDLNDLLFIRLGGWLAEGLKAFDERVIDGLLVNGTGRLTVSAGAGLRRIQTGRVQNYALGIAIGLILMAGSFLVLAGR
jgi:NADH-quinone oxidoreductase subunit L